jgi:hypothetical protein
MTAARKEGRNGGGRVACLNYAGVAVAVFSALSGRYVQRIHVKRLSQGYQGFRSWTAWSNSNGTGVE